MNAGKLDFRGDRGAILAAVLGAPGALVLSVFVHALLLLAVEAVAAAGVYAYVRIRARDGKSENGEAIESEFKEVKE